MNHVLTVLVDRLRKTDERMETLAFLDIYGRVARMVLEMARDNGTRMPDGSIFLKRPTHQEMAALIGVTRESVTKALKSMLDHGLIQSTGKEIIINPKQFEVF